MNHQYKIRQAVESDSKVLWAAERKIAARPGFLISMPDELTEASFLNKIKALSQCGYFVAENEEGIVAHAVLEPIATLSAMFHVYTLGSIVVHEGFQGKGIGTALMDAVLQWVNARPAIKKIELRVREGHDRAMRLYGRFGFVEKGRFEKRVKLPNGEYLADISMAWFASHPAMIAKMNGLILRGALPKSAQEQHE